MEVWAGASAGRMSEGSVAVDCTIMYRNQGASSNDTIGMVYVRNNRNRLQTELIIMAIRVVEFSNGGYKIRKIFA